MFDAIGTAGTGMQTWHTWLDVISENIANVNDEAPANGQVFRTHYMQAAANSDMGGDDAGTGVHVASLSQSSENGQLVQDPTDPLANADGYVRRSNIDLSQQMGDMIMAQRAFQANASTVGRAKDAYEAAINIGKGI